ncbi:MAG: lipopolysaccharide heptosyltransferase II [Hyphomicrobiales bacterium]|nr:lipopolysaccharide heptosyltransferase II [Hyphomicrobiales bacterium]
MNSDSQDLGRSGGAGAKPPVLLVPYLWIGDFVRCHTVVRLLNREDPARPVDVLASRLVAPLADYMPGVRKAVVAELPRRRLALAAHRALARRLRQEAYGQALIMPRTWKSALAPFLAGIPIRTGFFGEIRLGLLNDLRSGERALPRMVDRCAALAMPRGCPAPAALPIPELRVPKDDVARWRSRNALAHAAPAVVLAPGAVGPSKRWTLAGYRELAQRLSADGLQVWVIGGPDETTLAQAIAAGAANARDLTGSDLRHAILALAAADIAVSNDSGLLHVAAAIGTPAIGIFGPTSAWHWAPLNPLAAVVETATALSCRPCHKPTCRMGHHLCMQSVSAERLHALTLKALHGSAPAAH